MHVTSRSAEFFFYMNIENEIFKILSVGILGVSKWFVVSSFSIQEVHSITCGIQLYIKASYPFFSAFDKMKKFSSAR